MRSMFVVWKIPGDVYKFVKSTLEKEADDIPEELINEGKWIFEEVKIEQITVDEDLILKHDQEHVHLQRRDNFAQLIENETPILPLIVLGKEMFLVDGYARYRALKKLGISSVEVIKQEFND